jgi:hypothetical protein
MNSAAVRWLNEPAPFEANASAPGLCPRDGDQLFDVRHRQRGMHDQHIRRITDQRHRREALQHVVGRLRTEVRIDRQHARRREEQRVSVGRRARHHLRADRAAATAAVIDDELRAENFAELLHEVARHHIERAAGRRGDDDADGFGGVILCECGAAGADGDKNGNNDE